MYRNNPAVQFCQRAVRDGWLGQIFEVHAVMSKYQPLAYRQWLGQSRGGSMYIFPDDNACHNRFTCSSVTITSPPPMKTCDSLSDHIQPGILIVVRPEK